MNTSTASSARMSDLIATAQKLKSNLPYFDSLVMTCEVFQKVKNATEPGNVTVDRIFGYPVYVYDTLRECLDKMLELPKAQLVMEGQIPADLLFHPYFERQLGERLATIADYPKSMLRPNTNG
jgi:hypothetical protein